MHNAVVAALLTGSLALPMALEASPPISQKELEREMFVRFAHYQTAVSGCLGGALTMQPGAGKKYFDDDYMADLMLVNKNPTR